MKVFVQLRRNQDGVLPGVDEWGNVLSVDANDGDGFLTVRHGAPDGSVRRKSYGSGQWASFSVMCGGSANYEQFPADAEREHS